MDNYLSKIELDKALYSAISEEEFEQAIEELTNSLLFDAEWTSVIEKRVVPIIGDIPLVCKADTCPYAQKCPIIKNMNAFERRRLIDSNCRADRIYAAEQFTAWVKELRVTPDQTSDIVNVATLVRYLIIQRRISWALAIDGLIETEVATVNQRTGQAYMKRTIHPLFKEMDKVDNQIQKLQKQLLADRQSKMAAAQAIGGGSDLLKELLTNRNLALPVQSQETEYNFITSEEPESLEE